MYIYLSISIWLAIGYPYNSIYNFFSGKLKLKSRLKRFPQKIYYVIHRGLYKLCNQVPLMMLIKAESLEKGRTLVKSFHQPHRKKTRSSGTIKLILFFNLYSSPEEQGWKIRNPSGCYPADIHWMEL